MRTTLRRFAAVAAPALVLSGLSFVAAPTAVAAPPYDPAPVAAAAAWDVSQMSGNLLSTNFGGTDFKDYGLTADFAISLADVGGHTGTVSAINGAVKAEIDNYISDGSTGGATESYAGPLGKSIVLVKAAGDDPTTYGPLDDVNLVARLEARVGTGIVNHPLGRIEDKSAFGDFANVFGQAYAAQALQAVSSPRAADATNFLLAQQCTAGFFRLNFATPGAADQTCNGATTPAQPDTDVTAYAIIALRSQVSDPGVSAALAKAVTWLQGSQKADGSFGGSGPTAASNANSTGLAGWALGRSGATADAEQAAIWLRQHQLARAGGCTTYATADRGAVAYDDGARAAAASTPLTPTTRGQYVRATAQALPALQWAPLGPSTVAEVKQAAGRFTHAGSPVTISATSANPGDAVCISLRGGAPVASLLADASGAASTTVTLPAGDDTRTYNVIDSSGQVATYVFNVLDKAAVKIKAPKSVKSGKVLVVKISGLAKDEDYKVLIDGKKAKKGTATGEKVTLRLKSGQVGKHKLTVVGAFADRTGKVRYRVTR
jgi:hypothetical protein